MTINSPTSNHSTSRSAPDHGDGVAGGAQYQAASDSTAAQGTAIESTAVQGMVGAAMVGLLGGGPRLAMRAARVVLAEGYSSRYSSRQGRLHRRTRRRGD
jgi:hypothetical protein